VTDGGHTILSQLKIPCCTQSSGSYVL